MYLLQMILQSDKTLLIILQTVDDENKMLQHVDFI